MKVFDGRCGVLSLIGFSVMRECCRLISSSQLPLQTLIP